MPRLLSCAMVYRCGVIPILAALFAVPLLGDELPLAPKEGVLLLKNGHVMQGNITKAGDFFVLTLGKTGEVRLRAADVDTQCVDLDDAYRYQAALLSGKKAEPHLKLAEWCLRNGLRQQAEDQVNFARQIDPQNGRLNDFDQRLKRLAQAPAASAVKAVSSSSTVGAKQLDETLDNLPKGSVEKFSVVVQPMLINRCGANGCHGPAAKSDFHLLRPSAGQMMTKRFTQRNLFTVLQFLDKDTPEASRLLTVPQQRHGGMSAPVFDKRSQHQLDDLVAWVKHLSPQPPHVALPSTVNPRQTLLSQPKSLTKAGSNLEVEQADHVEPETPSAAKPRNRRPRVPLPPADGVGVQGDSDRDFSPRDPFDPEIFNRNHRK